MKKYKYRWTTQRWTVRLEKGLREDGLTMPTTSRSSSSSLALYSSSFSSNITLVKTSHFFRKRYYDKIHWFAHQWKVHTNNITMREKVETAGGPPVCKKKTETPHMDAKHSANTLRAMVTQKSVFFFILQFHRKFQFFFLHLTISQKIFRYVSDLISVHRSLPDLRGEWCKEKDRSTQIIQMQRQRQK